MYPIRVANRYVLWFGIPIGVGAFASFVTEGDHE